MIEVILSGAPVVSGGKVSGVARCPEGSRGAVALLCRLTCTAKSDMYTEKVCDETATVPLDRSREPRDVEFTVPVPKKAPVTFDGKIFAVTWTLAVSLDVPFARDPKVEIPLTVGVPRPRAGGPE